MRYEPQGLDRYAKFEHQETRIRQSFHRHKPDWKDQYLELIKLGYYDLAHELRLRNDERYRESAEQEAAALFPQTGSQLKSLSEAQSEREEEMEYV